LGWNDCVLSHLFESKEGANSWKPSSEEECHSVFRDYSIPSATKFDPIDTGIIQVETIKGFY